MLLASAEDLLDFLDGNMLWVMIIAVFFLGTVGGAIKAAFSTNARERSRREIAAYIAEGSMTPEQGERLMNAGDPDRCA
ncbi:MAG: hypothetical protein AAGD00_06925 [Planctomycetota bacterium]